jgi:NACalpha-BTF3-like transcription factor
MDTNKKEEEQNTKKNENNEASNNNEVNQQETIIDLAKLAGQSEIKNSDIILAIFEICTFNKKYNYECSNNTKAFWERVVDEEILKKIFKNFKSETLRKYWKIIRFTGDNNKFIEIVKHNEKFINNPVFKLLPIINGISSFIQSNTDQKNFEDYFSSLNSKDKKPITHKEDNNTDKKDDNEPRPKVLKIKKHHEDKEKEKEESEKEEIDPKILQLDDVVNKLMKISKYSREEVFKALYGTSGNVKNAYLFLMDNIKYEKYNFVDTDDYVIRNLKKKSYYKDLLDKKGEELIKEREKFLGIKRDK